MATLTVGYVAGIIAFLTFIVSFLFPNIIAVLIAAFVGRERSAVTWSVVGRELQSSIWPLVLRSDTTASSNIPLSVRSLSWLQKIAYLLVTVASIVTPLGLQSELKLNPDPRNEAFSYAPDVGPMAAGTPPRDPNGFFNRVCPNYQTVGECPFSDTKVTFDEDKGSFLGVKAHWDGTYDVRMPYVTAEVFSSVHDEHARTVSGAFDIEWRQYSYTKDSKYNSGEKYQIGFYRPLNTLMLNDAIEAVEGLLVDTRNGGIAFRNHSIPKNIGLGAEWTEELLFITPESVCVDTNLTLDFQIAPVGSDAEFFGNGKVNVALVDHGGFVDLVQEYPEPNGGMYDGQNASDLHFRAYKGAWVNNAYTAIYFNATNPSMGKYKHAFKYMTSEKGKNFWLNPSDVSYAATDAMQIGTYGSYIPSMNYTDSLNGTFSLENITSFNNDPRAVYKNPWYVSSDNFSIASITCQGAGGADHANISNIAVACGLMYGAAERQGGGQSLIQEPESWWTQKLYSCASTIKADIKKVTFSWNGTSEQSHLRRLQIVKIVDKEYQSKSDEPFWAAENLHRQLVNMNPLWGLISSEMAQKYADNENFDIVQSPRMYVPGYSGMDYFPYDKATNYLPASDALISGLAHAYSSTLDSLYTGSSSMAMLSKWQQLSRNATTAALIPNLIWTDLMANAVIGTRSWFSSDSLPNNLQPKPSGAGSTLSKRATSTSTPEVPVYLYHSKVTYNWLYAIPAMMTLAVFAVVLAIVLSIAIIGRLVQPKAMSMYLNYTSAGRLLSIIAERDSPSREDKFVSYEDLKMKSQVSLISTKSKPLVKVWEDENIYTSSREWVDKQGRSVINLESMSKDSKPPGNNTQSPKISAPSLHGSYRSLPRSDFQRLHSSDGAVI